METLTPKNLFLNSLNRCAESDDFIATFYARFLGASDEVREKFKHTDFDRQNKMLLRSLRLTAGAASGDVESLQELRERAETHDRLHLDIPPRLYELWRDAIIETAREFDPAWDAEVEQSWRSILGHVIHQMTKHY